MQPSKSAPPRRTQSPAQVLSRAEVAKLLNCSISTVKRLEARDALFPKPLLCGLRKLGFLAPDVARFQTLQRHRAATRTVNVPDASVGSRAGVAARAAKRAARAADNPEQRRAA